MSCISPDLTIDGALADPVIAAAMRADRVDPRHFETLLRSTARDLVGERHLRAKRARPLLHRCWSATKPARPELHP